MAEVIIWHEQEKKSTIVSGSSPAGESGVLLLVPPCVKRNFPLCGSVGLGRDSLQLILLAMTPFTDEYKKSLATLCMTMTLEIVNGK